MKHLKPFYEYWIYCKLFLIPYLCTFHPTRDVFIWKLSSSYFNNLNINGNVLIYTLCFTLRSLESNIHSIHSIQGVLKFDIMNSAGACF